MAGAGCSRCAENGAISSGRSTGWQGCPMPDWERIVAERLARSRLTPEIRREVVAEIAAHLEEYYVELLKAGRTDAEAATLAQVSDWRALRRRIQRSKEDPMNFARKVVMPGIAAVTLALVALNVFVSLLVTPQPCGPDLSGDPQVTVDTTCILVSADGPAYLPWLAMLALAGALAAGLARRMGARSNQRLLAAIFPAFYLAGEMFVIGLGHGFYWRIPIYWVVIPAIAGALGAIPFLRDRQDPIDTRPVATALP
jgi:hypothetical protein